MLRIVFLGLALSTIGCTCGEPPRASRPPPAPATEPPPPPAAPPEPREVSFTTSDGVRIGGTLRPPAAGEPIVILVHQLGSTRAEWAPLIERFERAPRIASLAIDVRGHGASTAGPEGPLAYDSFSNEQWAATQEDVRGALAWLLDDPAIAPSSVLVIGSSIGSTAAIAAAAREPAIGAVIALSPGRAYHGFDAITPGVALAGRPFLGIVAADEIDGVETTRALARITSTEAVIVPGSAHGVALLAEPATLDLVESFVRRTLQREIAE